MGRTHYLIIIMAIVTVVLCLAASVVLAFVFSKSAQVYYLNSARESATSVNNGISSFIEAAENYLEHAELPPGQASSPYKMFGKISPDMSYTVYIDGENFSGELNPALYNKYKESRFLGGDFSEFGIEEDLLLVSVNRETQHAGEYDIFFAAAPALPIITVLGFKTDNVVIAWSDGRTLYSIIKYENPNLNTIFGNSITQNLSSEDSTNASYSLNGAPVDVIFSSLSEYGVKTLLVSDGANISAFVTQYIIRYIIITLLILALLSGVAVACSRMYISSYNRMYAIRSDNVYELKVNQNGKIIRANNNFVKSFTADNIFNYTFDFEKSDSSRHFKRFTEGEAIHLKLPNSEGDIRYLTFIQLKYRTVHSLVGADVTETNEKLVGIMNSYMYNPFTGVPNINSLREDFKSEKRDELKEKIMMFVEVANLSRYTLLFGERFTLSVLKKTSDLLSEKMNGLVYHMNNDIFAVVLKNEEVSKFVTNVDTILNPFSSSMQIGEMLVMTDIRFGIVKVNNPFDFTYGEYLNMCRVALDNAKRSVRNKYYIFYANSDLTLPTDFSAETVIEQMMKNNEIDVFFQPIYGVKEKRIVAFEALSRIVGARKDEISLAQLVEIIEKSGNMITFGRFVYKKAILFAKLLQGKGITVSINISPIQLMHTGFVDEFYSELVKQEVEERAVNIELTENILIHSVDDVKQKLNILADKGINAYLDDYGTGYSSLAYISALPFNTVKIDKSLIDSLTSDPKAYTIVENTVNMMRSLGKKIIVEGVESKEQYKILHKLGCDMVQGYLISMALPAGEALDAIESKREIL